MTTRSKLNLFAAAVIAAGGFALSGASPAQAAVFDGCDDMREAIQEEAQKCWDMNGERMTYSGSCNSTGYTLTTNCYIQVQ